MGKCFHSLIGIIPSEWKLISLSELAAIIDCEHKTAPASKVPTEWVSLRTTNIREGFLDLSEIKSITKEDYKEWTRRGEPQPGDVIFTREAPVGMVALVPNDLKVALGRRMVKITPQDLMLSKFLMYSLLSRGVQKYMMKRSAGTTAKRFDVSEIEKLPIPLPSKDEQKRIIEILETVDESIESSKVLAKKHGYFKNGLLQRLLTKGIGHTEFKKSKIGKIPEEWEVFELSETCEISSGTQTSYEKRVEGSGYPVYGANGRLGWCQEFNMKEGLVIGRVGASGTVHFVKEPIWANDNTLILQNMLKVSPKFLYYWLVHRDLARLATKTAQPLLTQKVLKRVKVPKPTLKEQDLIVKMLETVDAQIKNESKLAITLDSLRKGLMQVLLTGNVRVRA